MATSVTTERRVTAADIARLAGVGRAAVSNWRRRHDDFPESVGGTRTSPMFDLGEIQAWLRSNGKIGRLSPAESMWLALDGLSGTRNLAQSLTLLGLVMLARGRSSWRGGATLRDSVPNLVARLVPPDADETAAPLAELLAELDDGDDAELFDRLYTRFVQATSKQIVVTPPFIADLLVELTGAPGGTIIDPACGTGTLLRAAAAHGARVVGQEVDADLAGLAAVRVALLSPDDEPPQIAVGDSLRADAWPELRADAAVCHPPVGQRDWGGDELAHDPRWEFGSPPRSEPELAWIQHLLAHVRPGGHVVTLMPPGTASRRTGRRVRAELLRRGALRAVAALPAGGVPWTGLPVHVWILQRPPTDEVRAEPTVLLVDAGSVRDEAAADPAATIRNAWAAVGRGDDRSYGAWLSVPVIDLLDEDVDVNPVRHLRGRVTTVVAEDVVAARKRAEQALGGIEAAIPDVVAVTPAVVVPVVSVGDLARSGALAVLHHIGRVETVGADDPGRDMVPVLSGGDIVAGRDASTFADAATQGLYELHVGDVVVAGMGDRVRTRVIEAKGWVLGSNAYLLRPDPGVLDARFLAGMLRSSSNARFAGGTLASRVDIRRLEVPRVTFDEQRRLATVLSSLTELETRTAAAAEAATRLAQLMTDGLVGGSLQPVRGVVSEVAGTLAAETDKRGH